MTALRRPGCPIRTPADRWVCAPPRRFSQLAASFIASGSPGIPRTPFLSPAAYTATHFSLVSSMSMNSRSKNHPARAEWFASCGRGGLLRSGPFVMVEWALTCCGALRKEIFQPHLPVRLPCYDLAPVAGFTLTASFTGRFRSPRLPWLDGRCVQGPGTYSPRHS